MKNPILKYVAKHNTEDVIHSSAYARAHRGANIGASSSESFATRQRVEAERRYVQGYRNAKIINGARPAGGARVYTPSQSPISRPSSLSPKR